MALICACMCACMCVYGVNVHNDVGASAAIAVGRLFLSGARLRLAATRAI